jgi:hypothetical protein
VQPEEEVLISQFGGRLSVKDAAVASESRGDEERVGGCGGVGM